MNFRPGAGARKMVERTTPLVRDWGRDAVRFFGVFQNLHEIPSGAKDEIAIEPLVFFPADRIARLLDDVG